MKKAISTGEFDKNNRELFVGDKVMKTWGSCFVNGEATLFARIHTIVPHYKERGRFMLGEKTANLWEGKDVVYIADDDPLLQIIPEDTNFLFDGNTPRLVTGEDMFGKENFQSWMDAEAEITRQLMFGKKDKG